MEEAIMERRKRAVAALEGMAGSPLVRLGEGQSSVVFHDGRWVYKVFVPVAGAEQESVGSWNGAWPTGPYFFDGLEWVAGREGTKVLRYRYEEGVSCTQFDREEIIGFLLSCWQQRIVFRDVKPANFIRVGGKLKWVDYEPEGYSDNLFLNMVVRAFVYVRYGEEDAAFVRKLCRSAINQFDLPELAGVQDFVNAVFGAIVYAESEGAWAGLSQELGIRIGDVSEVSDTGECWLPYDHALNAEALYWTLLNQGMHLREITPLAPVLDVNHYFSPQGLGLSVDRLQNPPRAVSLMIKACVQDAGVLFESVRHLVRQLASPHRFSERILALDIRKESFLREYDDTHTWDELLGEADRLCAAGIIDRVVYPTETDLREVNQRWFGLDTAMSHTTKGVPVGAQLYGFDQAREHLILQMDCDVMVGRLDRQHGFLEDMIAVLSSYPQAVSVGFNIYQGQDQKFTLYFGLEEGGFVPEVRCCLLDRNRLKALCPLPNAVEAEGLRLSWYRSVEQQQKLTHTCSVRGGDSRSFYVHPQNFKKTDKDVWFTTVDRVEQGYLPEKQKGAWDLAGSYYDWGIAPRNEELVLVSCFRNVSLPRFLRYWYSLISQSYTHWGLILIDDASSNGLSHFINALVTPYRHRVTFIHNRFAVGVGANTYKAIHHFMTNPDSVVCILDGDDALLGKDSLQQLMHHYTVRDADMVVGKMYRTDKLQEHYPYTPNFTNPRAYGGNVWQHLRSFRKYLFDSLDFRDLKIPAETTTIAGELLSRRFSQQMVFPPHCVDFSYMVPMAEMADNPQWIDRFNVIHDRTARTTPQLRDQKEQIIQTILSKPKKTRDDILRGRRTFLPNLDRIELDLTYACNLKCINCNRSSTQAPTQEGMAFDQIAQFVADSITLGKQWHHINLLGGEPTLYPQFLEVIDLILYGYITPHAPQCILQVTSNGYGDEVQRILAQLPHHANLVLDTASYKEDRVVSYFAPFNLAPVDNPEQDPNEYHKGCWVTAYCGLGLNQLGYYPCGVAGGIDRVMGLNLGLKSLFEVDEHIKNLLENFCGLCGNFTAYHQNQGNFIPRHQKEALTKPALSPIWRNAYQQYNAKK